MNLPVRTAIVSAMLSTLCSAQPCQPYGSDAFSVGPNGGVFASAWVESNDGDLSPGLYVGGIFSTIGSLTARRVARWDGESWFALGNGLTGTVATMAVLDIDGPGPLSPKLFVGGDVSVSVGGETLRDLVSWDGVQFAPVGTGLSSSAIGALFAWDEDGEGPGNAALYAHGLSLQLDGQAVRGAVRWDPSGWTAMPFPGNWGVPNVYGGAFAEFDADGAGPDPARLHLGAGFLSGPGPLGAIARWNGQGWEMLGNGLFGGDANGSPFVYSMKSFDEDGDGPADPVLYVCGDFDQVDGLMLHGLARWDGSNWSAAGSSNVNRKLALETFDVDGRGPEANALYLSDLSGYLERFDGVSWESLGQALGQLGSAVTMLAVSDSGVPKMFLAGGFATAFGVPAQNVTAYIGCAPPCTGDIDGNGLINIADLAVLLSHFGTPDGATASDGDLDEDADVDIQDLALMLADFGMSCP